MIAGPHNSNPKWHSPAPTIHSAQIHTTAMQTSASSGRITAQGAHNLPGGHTAQFLAEDYGQERHMAYDSPFAQPAYSGHGKVQVGRGSAL